ncbi:MAG: hypothetical protein PHU21_06130, partial [Elusimicrobia bacterium]|nr:hypothetical protein [Elusimicrobiota bacterium]
DESCGLVVPYPSLAAAPRRLAEALDAACGENGRLLSMGRCARERAAAMPFSRAADAVLRACQEVLAPAGEALR